MRARQYQRRSRLRWRIVREVKRLHIESVWPRVDDRVGMPVLRLEIASFDDVQKRMIVYRMGAHKTLYGSLDLGQLKHCPNAFTLLPEV